MTFAVVAVILALVGVFLAAISHRPAKSKSKSPAAAAATPSGSSASPAGNASSTTAPSAGQTLTVGVPLVVCPTTFGTTAPPAANLPSTVTATVPDSLVGQLSVYSDKQGTMRLVAPKGWQCSAAYGADGSGGVSVYPAGVSVPAGGVGAGWHLSSSSTAQAVTGQETSACSSCTTGQACPLFSAAAQAFQSALAKPCPRTRPKAETVHRITANMVGFQDPPGTPGDGAPSGGANAASGVMTYYPSNPNGSWMATCTLPSADQQVCTVALNTFQTSYQNN